MHVNISPAILYWGTPVVLVSSLNESSTTNICAISSAFWLGHRCMLGFAAGSATPQNIRRTGQCVLNLPSEDLVGAVNALATTTGTVNPSASKLARGYRYVADKWVCAGLTPQPSEAVQPHRIQECPVQMECELVETHGMLQDTTDKRGFLVCMEVKVLRVHVLEELKMEGYENRIDPDRWRPMIMTFQELYGLRGKIGPSTLGQISEEKYRALAEVPEAARLKEKEVVHVVDTPSRE